MKISINDKLSKILDFIYYPYVGRFCDEILSSEAYDDIDYEVEGYEEILQNTKKKMKGYFEVIEKFYSTDGAIISYIIGKDVLFQSADIDDYLSRVLGLDVEIINKNMIKLLLDILDKQEMIENDVREEKYKDKDYMLTLIKSTALSPSMKWALLCAIDNPKGYIEEYVEFMRKIKPNFDEMWIQADKEIKKYREGFVKELENHGMDFLNRISGELIKEDNLKFFDSAIMCLSYFEAATIRLMEFDNTLLFHWGYKVEEAYEYLMRRKEFEFENRLRVIKTLGDKTKYKMLKLIAENPEICANDIIEQLELTGATVSYHINLMSTYKILKITKTNKKNSYEIDKSTLVDFLQGIIHDFKLEYSEN
ncbi:ArsR/SmtB family transcription factor [Oceanirhabdus sp. W0125-5]|uniref:ArsR/SmtB family transcription factor n=1 Tax=Oceanirhabdus sp. W0125-5 TaxID=2999116 RepID=UPI0022F2BCA4|nr:winged helix-turn-helix domain-containing protein [Oceanirhabdus sp. W0125-5]WBW96898.1 winged helix-turn-helix domain-containing protein [Oceanirhabdus sp. W0125-5]